MVNVDENKEYTEENIQKRTKRGDIVVVNVLLPYAPFKHSLLQSFNPLILQSFKIPLSNTFPTSFDNFFNEVVIVLHQQKQNQ